MTFDPLISIFVLIFFLCMGGSGRVRRLRRRRSSRAPTRNQLEYIRTLININNRYRAVPWSLEDWIEKYFKGNWDFSCASHLISKLKEENGVKSNEFAEKIKSSKSRQRECFFASDLGLYLYCPNTIFWIFKGYANKNLYEVNTGALYHGDLGGRDRPAKENTNTSFLLKAKASLKKVEWCRLHESEPFYLKKYNLSGIPDGVGQNSQDRIAFEVSFKEHEQQFQSTFDEMRRNVNKMNYELYDDSKKRCRACGFRHLCRS